MNWTELVFEAVEIDDVDLVRKSLTHSADVHAIVDGRSILSASISLRKRDEENIEIIQLLLEVMLFILIKSIASFIAMQSITESKSQTRESL